MSTILVQKQPRLEKISVQNTLAKNKISPTRQSDLKWEDIAGLSWILLDKGDDC